MDSAIIRSLIFEANLTQHQGGLHLTHIANTVIALAVEKELLSRGPDHQADDVLKDRIWEVVWGLILEGIYAPGSELQNPNLPFLHITEYGKRCFKAGELVAHDPDKYLERLKTECTAIDRITLMYLGEALDTFRAGNYLATAVMLGVAAEQTLFLLVNAVHSSLDSQPKQQSFLQKTQGKKAKKQHDQVMARIKSPSTPLPPNLASNIELHVGGIYDLIRQTRNDAGHPTGRELQRPEANALLLLFPTYCRTVYDLMDWLGKNQI